MSDSQEETYGLSKVKAATNTVAPALNYLPTKPKNYSPNIGLVGAGGITNAHLKNYKELGYNVVAIADVNSEAAEEKRKKYYPEADVYTDANQIFKRGDIEVVDIATHPGPRLKLIEAALTAEKHVLSQKPYVLDLDEGHRLVELANKHDRKLAVNQNGRWAPHFSYANQAIKTGLIGDITSIDTSSHFNHSWIAGTEFEKLHHMVLYDFAIHWFDIVNLFMNGQKALNVYASVRKFPGQAFRPPALAHVTIDYEGAQVGMNFNAHTTHGEQDVTTIVGTQGTLHSEGKALNDQHLTLFTEGSRAEAELAGDWFENGFQGTMSELLCSIEENREPSNSAASSLKSLELCFAAIASADSGQSYTPGSVRKIEL